MNLLGNLIWLVFGGLLAALGYMVGGFVLCITVVGIPWGLQCFKLAGSVGAYCNEIVVICYHHRYTLGPAAF